MPKLGPVYPTYFPSGSRPLLNAKILVEHDILGWLPFSCSSALYSYTKVQLDAGGPRRGHRLFYRLLLLTHCSTDLSGRFAKERIDPFGRLMYHCKAGPVNVWIKPFNIVASMSSFWIATASIRCLYW